MAKIIRDAGRKIGNLIGNSPEQRKETLQKAIAWTKTAAASLAVDKGVEKVVEIAQKALEIIFGKEKGNENDQVKEPEPEPEPESSVSEERKEAESVQVYRELEVDEEFPAPAKVPSPARAALTVKGRRKRQFAILAMVLLWLSQLPLVSQQEVDFINQRTMIVWHNDNLRRQERDGSPAYIFSEFAQPLQFHNATHFDNKQPRATQQSGRPITSPRTRLKAKAGCVRGNLMGKRVESSAPTVITPDPNFNNDELGVPWSIALNLTYPETVTPYNIERLKKLVNYGPHPPPGKTRSKSIFRNDGQRLDLRCFLKKSSDHHLQLGYKAERHFNGGDLELFSRQPSLHKMPIMGNHIKIMPYSTFRLNLSVTSLYSADFNVDQMNMHAPQSFETRAHVLELMMVPKCILSPQANKPVNGIVQDTLLGCRRFTKRDATFIEQDVFMNILMRWEDFDVNIPQPAILKPRPIWTGNQVVNLIIPTKINLVRFAAWHREETEKGFLTPASTRVLIEKWELLNGTLCKKMLGTSSGSLVHVIWPTSPSYSPSSPSYNPSRPYNSGPSTEYNSTSLQYSPSAGYSPSSPDNQ